MNKKITVPIAVVSIAFFVCLPFLMGTSSYPIAIVNGNSMYPTVHNGDLVFFHSIPQQNIPNGTIIVFVQADTGSASLDSIVRPVVIHRVIGMVVQADGTDYYKTKGDNNQLPDPSLAKSTYVLGSPYFVIPRVGIIFLFIESPQGLVAAIGFITLFYISSYESKARDEKKKEKLLARMARGVTSGEMSIDQFKKFEIAIKYGDQGEEPISRKIIDLRPVVKRLRSQGWEVETSPTIKGESGVFHQFDLTISSKGETKKLLLVLDLAFSEKMIDESHVISMYSKDFDVRPRNAVLLALPGASKEALELAKLYKVIVIEVETLNQVPAIILGATSSILEGYREPDVQEEDSVQKKRSIKALISYRMRRRS